MCAQFFTILVPAERPNTQHHQMALVCYLRNNVITCNYPCNNCQVQEVNSQFILSLQLALLWHLSVIMNQLHSPCPYQETFISSQLMHFCLFARSRMAALDCSKKMVFNHCFCLFSTFLIDSILFSLVYYFISILMCFYIIKKHIQYTIIKITQYCIMRSKMCF